MRRIIKRLQEYDTEKARQLIELVREYRREEKAIVKRIVEADESADNCYPTLQLVVERRDKNIALKIQQLKDALPRYRTP